MVDLQELIVRGRMIFDGAGRRYEVFALINGRRSTREIATKTGRSLVAVDNDIGKLRDVELVREKEDNEGKLIRKGGSVVYEKTPLVRVVPASYFRDLANTSKLVKATPTKRVKS